MRIVVSLLALSFLCLFGAFAPVSAVALYPNKCADNTLANDTNKAGVCQFAVLDGKQAPNVSNSLGIRLDRGVKNVLFTSHQGLNRYVHHNSTTSDIFVPQKTKNEFFNFLTYAPNVTWDYAVKDIYYNYLTSMGSYSGCPASVFTITNPSVLIAGTNAGLTAPISGYSLLPDGSTATVSLGWTSLDSVIMAYYNRQNQSQDCIYDNEYNSSCAHVEYEQDQELTFVTVPVLYDAKYTDYEWRLSNTSSALYVSVNNGNSTTVGDCSGGYSSSAPVIKGACGSAHGQNLSAAPAASIPSTYLCAKGNTSTVTANSTGWSWTCNGVGTGATSADNASCSAGEAPCPAWTAVYWPKDDNSCGGTTSTVTASGNNTPSINNTGTKTGSAIFKCTRGTLYEQPGSTCSTPAVGCSVQNVDWTVLGVSCSGPTVSVTSGTTYATSNNGNNGEALYTCNDDGTLTGPLELGKSCTAPPPGPINGQCGGAINQTTSTAPTAALCNPYDTPPVSGPTSGKWTWDCAGQNEGIVAHCSSTYTAAAKPVNGQCGDAIYLTTSTAPTVNLCSPDEQTTVSGPTGGKWTWDCFGQDDGVVAHCSSNYHAIESCPAKNFYNQKAAFTIPSTFSSISYIARGGSGGGGGAGGNAGSPGGGGGSTAIKINGGTLIVAPGGAGGGTAVEGDGTIDCCTGTLVPGRTFEILAVGGGGGAGGTGSSSNSVSGGGGGGAGYQGGGGGAGGNAYDKDTTLGYLKGHKGGGKGGTSGVGAGGTGDIFTCSAGSAGSGASGGAGGNCTADGGRGGSKITGGAAGTAYFGSIAGGGGGGGAQGRNGGASATAGDSLSSTGRGSVDTDNGGAFGAGGGGGGVRINYSAADCTWNP